MYLLNNVHYKQQNLNITQILTLVLSHSSFYQVFFLNISKQLSSLSSILLSTLSKYFIPMTKNVWLPTTPKFDLFPRKTQGQLDHQIHFLPPLFSLFFWGLFSCFKLISLLSQSSHSLISKGSSCILRASSAQYFRILYWRAADTWESVHSSTYCIF